MPHRFWLTLLLRTGRVACLCLALAGWPGTAPVAQAGAITVNSTADTSGGPACTLRDAITAANTNSPVGSCATGFPGLDTITFNLGPACSIHPCPITLGSPLPTITEDLTITAGGGPIILSGGGATRLLSVNSGITLHLQHLTLENASNTGSDGGAIANDGNLWLESSTIQNSQTDSGHSGGAIFSDGPLTMTNSTLQANQAGSGGALFANFGNAIVTISNSTFISNAAVATTTTGYGGAIWAGSLAQVSITGGAIVSNTAGQGGGLYLSPGAVVWLTSSGTPASVSGNSATEGGGIRNDQGTLTVTNVLFSSNTATGAGAVSNFGTAILANVTLSGNKAVQSGGAIGNPQGNISLDDSTLSGNSAQTSGGGIWNWGTLTMTNDTLRGNSAQTSGGGIENLPAGISVPPGVVTLGHATLSGNSAHDGGGLHNLGVLTATNVTLSGNTAVQGGGIYNQGNLTVTNSTLSGNDAADGGGLYQAALGPAMTLASSIVAHGANGANCFDQQSSQARIASAGYNLTNDTSCTADLNAAGDQNEQNPNLGPLADNGGPTLTQMPNPPSPAIDAIALGVNDCGTTLTSDQRGAPRPIHGKCDIGAVEYGWLYRYLWLALVRR